MKIAILAVSKGVLKVTSGIVEWYKRSCGDDFDIPEIPGPVKPA